MGPKGSSINILAKVDNLESLHKFEEILAGADGIIFDRLEVGLEVQPEKAFLAQRWVIERSNAAGKPVYIKS